MTTVRKKSATHTKSFLSIWDPSLPHTQTFRLHNSREKNVDLKKIKSVPGGVQKVYDIFSESSCYTDLENHLLFVSSRLGAKIWMKKSCLRFLFSNKSFIFNIEELTFSEREVCYQRFISKKQNKESITKCMQLMLTSKYIFITLHLIFGQ